LKDIKLQLIMKTNFLIAICDYSKVQLFCSLASLNIHFRF